jgi:hypothetical protein
MLRNAMIAAGAAVLLGWSLNVTDANAQTRYEQQRQNSYQSFKKGPSANNPRSCPLAWCSWRLITAFTGMAG